MSTIKQVAALAKVSIATVSYVLNNSRPVKPETYERVMNAAKELNYIPNSAARNLKTAHSRSIGFVMPDIRNALHADILNSFSQSLQNQGYQVHVTFSNNDPQQERICLDGLIASNVDGAVIITCQPSNTGYFQSAIGSRHLPAVFLEREPSDFPSNFIGFDNYRSLYKITSQLIQRSYRNILLLCGDPELSSERDCIRGYRDALTAYGADQSEDSICVTGFTKEEAFRDFLEHYTSPVPQAVICTSREIAKGVQLGLHYNNIQSPDQLLLLCLGEDSWENMVPASGVYLVNRPAISAGKIAAETILRLIQAPESQDTTIRNLKDSASGLFSHFPDAGDLVPVSPMFQKNATGNPSLRILVTDLQSTRAIHSLSRHFSAMTGIDVDYIVHPQETLSRRILNAAHNPNDSFDIITYNAPWRDYMHEQGRLSDISSLISEGLIDTSLFFPESIDNCMIDGKCFGIPYTAGGQILFYRKDLFENSDLSNAYEKEHGAPLRKPGTWKEYNHIASFFTKSLNPDSPTEYGASFAGYGNEHLAPELLSRIFSFGGALWNHYNQPVIHSPANENAFQSALETLKYVPPHYEQKSIQDVIKDFVDGKTAMVIAFTEHATYISRILGGRMQAKVGSGNIPGNCPVRAGWNFGITPESKHKKEACRYLEWFCQQSTSFYLTVLNGASPFIEPYHNHDLQNLYPWLKYSEESIRKSRLRNPAKRADLPVIPSGKIEAVICDAFTEVESGKSSISDALDKAQEEAIALYRHYGYPVSVRGFGSSVF